MPEVDPRGLFPKYEVKRRDGGSAPGARHHKCRYFVLDLDHDLHALPAIVAYAESCAATHPQLSADLMRLAEEILDGLTELKL